MSEWRLDNAEASGSIEDLVSAVARSLCHRIATLRRFKQRSRAILLSCVSPVAKLILKITSQRQWHSTQKAAQENSDWDFAKVSKRYPIYLDIVRAWVRFFPSWMFDKRSSGNSSLRERFFRVCSEMSV